MVRVFVRDDIQAKDMTEGRDSEGGYLPVRVSKIPDPDREKYASSSAAVQWFYRCKALNWRPSWTGGVQVYWIGEGQTIPQTQPDFGEFRMTVKKWLSGPHDQ